MSEFKINPYENRALLEYRNPESGENYKILCNTVEHAQKIKISILLEALASPLVAPELYFKFSKDIFTPNKLASFEDNEEELDSMGCCQSGCAGCPTFRGIKL